MRFFRHRRVFFADGGGDVGLPQDQGGGDPGAGGGGGGGGAAGAGGGDGGGAPVAYDFEADPAGLGKLDLAGAKLGGEFGTVKEALDAVAALRAAQAVPETYDFGETVKDWAPEALDAVTKEFKELGMTQAQGAKVLPKVIAMAEELAGFKGRAALADQWELTGDALDKRVSEVSTWAQANIPADLYKVLARQGHQGLIMAGAMMQANWEKPMWPGSAWAGGGGGGDQKGEKSRADRIYGGSGS